jgi:hypothetical protein
MRGDLAPSFGAVAFPIHVWAIINLLNVFPAWLLRMSIGELAGGIGYTLTDALLESAILWGVLVLLGLLLPKKWLAERFVAFSSLLAWLLALWAAVVQFQFGTILQFESWQLALGMLVVVLTFVGGFWAVRHFTRLEDRIRRLVQGLAVVTYVYIVFDVLGLVAVILRNL